MDKCHWIGELQDIIIPYLSLPDLFNLLTTCQPLGKIYGCPLFWRECIRRFFPQVHPNGAAHITDRQLLRVLSAPHKYCSICAEPLRCESCTSKQCLLQLCECLGSDDYLRSHPDCLQIYIKPKKNTYMRVRSYICPFCGETRMCLGKKKK